jgi:hypothetical protein
LQFTVRVSSLPSLTSLLKESKLTDLTELAYGDKYEGVYPSVGGSDEFIRLYLYK